MGRRVIAWCALVALIAAIVPGGLGSSLTGVRSCCDANGRCAMRTGAVAMHCHHAGATTQQDAFARCNCSVSHRTASMVPPTAFHFILQLCAGQSPSVRCPDSAARETASCGPLVGFGSPKHQPPRA